MEEFFKTYLTLALTLLILTLIALPFLEPKSPSFIVGITAIVILGLFIVALVIIIKTRILKMEIT